MNNVENVFINRPLSSSYDIIVRARRVNVNAVTANPESIAQDYALVIASGNSRLSNNAPLITVSPPTASPPTFGYDPGLFLKVLTANTPQLKERVGANSPLLPLDTNGVPPHPSNGATNQWNFYVFQHNDAVKTNVAILTFMPPNMSRPRYRDADIDLYVSTDPGLTNLMVSTMASGNTQPYVGTADITIVFPVVDLSGLNRFSRAGLDNAGRALAGMARGGGPLPAAAAPEVAVTMFGATTPCVMAIADRLWSLGMEPVTFHANGGGGRALEAWIARGEFSGVLDVTTTELADELAGGPRSAGPHRLEAAGERGIPQVIAPGAMDMVNFGPPETVPERFRHRQFYQHNPTCAVRFGTSILTRKMLLLK